jgi:hypothetical protein
MRKSIFIIIAIMGCAGAAPAGPDDENASAPDQTQIHVSAPKNLLGSPEEFDRVRALMLEGVPARALDHFAPRNRGGEAAINFLYQLIGGLGRHGGYEILPKGPDGTYIHLAPWGEYYLVLKSGLERTYLRCRADQPEASAALLSAYVHFTDRILGEFLAHEPPDWAVRKLLELWTASGIKGLEGTQYAIAEWGMRHATSPAEAYAHFQRWAVWSQVPGKVNKVSAVAAVSRIISFMARFHNSSDRYVGFDAMKKFLTDLTRTPDQLWTDTLINRYLALPYDHTRTVGLLAIARDDREYRRRGAMELSGFIHAAIYLKMQEANIDPRSLVGTFPEVGRFEETYSNRQRGPEPFRVLEHRTAYCNSTITAYGEPEAETPHFETFSPPIRALIYQINER